MQTASTKQRVIPRKKKPLWLRILFWILAIIIFLGILGYTAFQVSPWPSALVIRKVFTDGGQATNAALEKYAPSNVSVILNEHYDAADEDAFLDVYFPSEIAKTDKQLPTVVWIHGGGWVAGDKSELSNYCKILASKGYTVVAVDYSLAPGKNYPTQIQQINAALLYIKNNAMRLHVNASMIVLAGDSAGSQLASQTANIISVPDYANQLAMTPSIGRSDLKGVILYCGPFDLQAATSGGAMGAFTESVLWSYSGTKDYANNADFKTASVYNYVTKDFPSAFISVGNGDPLEPQSLLFARKLSGLGVSVDSLFFPADYSPPLPHEYQFNLDVQAGNIALERQLEFLARVMQ